MEKIVVIGGGQAGVSLIAKLRTLGFDRDITLLCAENDLPYQRPPLSKNYLLGKMERERLFLRPITWYEENAITIKCGTFCTDINIQTNTVTAGNDQIPFDHLILTTGSIPHELPKNIGGSLPGVHTVRTLADIDGMSGSFIKNRNALIVGGGYIGLEAASAAVTRGMNVTLVEATERILMRVAAPETSKFISDMHVRNGVKLHENTHLVRLYGDGYVQGAQLSNGTVIDIDLVIVGIGIKPATMIAENAGIHVNNGIDVDGSGQTSVPRIWAAGDCTSFPWKGKQIRLESVQNAIDQAELVAENILGANKIYNPVPWFWSDQYDAKLQIAGMGTGYDRIVTRTGSKENSISFWYLKKGQLLAVDSINDSRSYMIGKRLLDMGKNVDPDILGNAAIDLKPLLRL